MYMIYYQTPFEGFGGFFQNDLQLYQISVSHMNGFVKTFYKTSQMTSQTATICKVERENDEVLK